MTDRLSLTRAFESSGMESAAAERIATEIFQASHDNLATKIDLREMKQRLRAEIFKAMHAQTLTLVGSMLGLLGVFFAALHLWPPH